MTGSTALLNRLYGRLLIEALRRGGCQFFCVSPGSRSTPLTLAVAEMTGITGVINHDERGAGFMAMGYGRAGDGPAVLICTSGTAAANYLPAVAEADAAGIPMIVITADRPVELQQCGANQTIDQWAVFGSRVRYFRQLPAPGDDAPPEVWLTAAAEAIQHCQTENPGPVHLNIPFREPLVDADSGVTHRWPALLEKTGLDHPVLRRWLDGDLPWRETISGSRLPDVAIERLSRQLGQAARPLVVIGAIADSNERRAIVRLADQLNCPILSDIQSGLAAAGVPLTRIVPHFDALLRSQQFRADLKPDLIIQFGARLVSKRLQQFLADRSAVPLLRFSGMGCDDPLHRHARVVTACITDTCNRLVSLARPAPWSLSAWGRLAIETVERLDIGLTEPGIAREVMRSGARERVLWLASSMPVRDVDTWGGSGIWGNIAAARGVSGIDGTISAALGFSRGCRAGVTALLGDLSTLHDLNALQQVAVHPWPVCLVVINNDGGGIFSMLPIREAAPERFEEWFATPHGRNFRQAAGMFGIAYRAPTTRAELAAALTEAQAEGDATLIEITTSRDAEQQFRQGLADTFSQLAL